MLLLFSFFYSNCKIEELNWKYLKALLIIFVLLLWSRWFYFSVPPFLLFYFINLNLLSPRKFIWLCYCVTAAEKADYFTFLLSDLRHLVTITLECFQLEWVLSVSVCLLQARKAAILMLFGGRAFSWLIHIAATLTILCVVLILAIFVPDIRNVFGVVGMWYFENTFNIWGGINRYYVVHKL